MEHHGATQDPCTGATFQDTTMVAPELQRVCRHSHSCTRAAVVLQMQPRLHQSCGSSPDVAMAAPELQRVCRHGHDCTRAVAALQRLGPLWSVSPRPSISQGWQSSQHTALCSRGPARQRAVLAARTSSGTLTPAALSFGLGQCHLNS